MKLYFCHGDEKWLFYVFFKHICKYIQYQILMQTIFFFMQHNDCFQIEKKNTLVFKDRTFFSTNVKSRYDVVCCR